VRGPRGLLLPDGDLPDGLDVLGLRVVDPVAAHPLLERLGALRATPRAVLADPAVRAAVATSYDADDPDAVADAVLGLVAAAGLVSGDEGWLGDLALPDDEGELAPARALVLPDGVAAGLLDADAVGHPAPDLLERWDRAVLAAVGVLDGLALTRDADVVLDPDTCDHDLDDEDAWVDAVAGDLAADDGVPPVAADLVAIRDLDLVRDDAWTDVLRHVAGDRDLRAAVVEPLVLQRADGRRATVPSYSAWWLRRHAHLGGHAPDAVRDPAGDPLLAGLWPDAPTLGVDAGLLRAIGVRVSLADVLTEPDGPDIVLERLAAPDATVPRSQLRALYAALATLDPDRVTPPTAVRVPLGSGSAVRPAADVVVVDVPDLLPYAGPGRSRCPLLSPPRSPTSSTSASRPCSTPGRCRRSAWNAPSPPWCPSCSPAQRVPGSSTTSSSPAAGRSTGASWTPWCTPRPSTVWRAGWPGRPAPGAALGDCRPAGRPGRRRRRRRRVPRRGGPRRPLTLAPPVAAQDTPGATTPAS
jgi:hypothetical protein